jgi:hypothetical protein
MSATVVLISFNGLGLAETFFAAWDDEAAIGRARDHPSPAPQARQLPWHSQNRIGRLNTYSAFLV